MKMLKELLDLNKEKVKGIIIGLEIILLLTGLMGLFFNVKYEKIIGEYPVKENYDVKLGETENINNQEVSAYTINTGYFTETCLNNVSITSSLASVGEIEGGTFCSGKKIYLEDWVIEVKDVHPKTNEAILIKIELKPIPLVYIWLTFIVLIIMYFLLNSLFNKINTKYTPSEEEIRRIVRDEVQTVKETEELETKLGNPKKR